MWAQLDASLDTASLNGTCLIETSLDTASPNTASPNTASLIETSLIEPSPNKPSPPAKRQRNLPASDAAMAAHSDAAAATTAHMQTTTHP